MMATLPEIATAVACMECRVCGHVDTRTLRFPVSYRSRKNEAGLVIDMDIDTDAMHDAPCPNCGSLACEPRLPREWEQ